MNVLIQLAIAVGSVAMLLGLMAVVRAGSRAYGFSAEVQRKLVHIGTGLFALTLPWLFPQRWPVYVLILLTFAVMAVLRQPRMAKAGLGQTLHGVERTSYGDMLLALAVGVVFLLSQGNAVLYVLPIAILTLADAAAALTGSRYGRQFFEVEAGRKSLEGSVAFFLVSLMLAMICLLLLSDVGRGNVILLSLMVAGFGTLVEADSWRGFDNFFLPAGLFVFLQANLDSTPWQLFGLIVVFAGAVWAMCALAPRIGSTSHAARVYVIAAFLLISVSQVQNVVLPLLVFVTHAICRGRNPSKAAYPELDIVAALALVSFGWLALGKLTGLNAVAFYGLSAMALCIGFATLALAPARHGAARVISVVIAAVLVALYLFLMRINPAYAHWMGNLMPFAVASALPPLLAGLLRAEAFYSSRAAKLAGLSVAFPLVAYLVMVTLQKGWI